MSSRKISISLVVVVVLGAGTWLMLSGGIRQDEGGPLDLSAIDSSKEESGVTPSTPPVAANGTTDYSASNPDETPQPEDSPRAPAAWPESALAFAEQPDPEPALSRDLEELLERSMVYLLDKSRYELQSIKCRGSTCQLLTVDRAPSAEGGLDVVTNAMFSQLKDGIARHPISGVTLQPELRMLRPIRAGKDFGFITLIGFEGPTPESD